LPEKPASISPCGNAVCRNTSAARPTGPMAMKQIRLEQLRLLDFDARPIDLAHFPEPMLLVICLRHLG
jgi:hypothetical protein